MLKNNQEREKYIRDEKNWDVLEYDVVQSFCVDEESDKELHGGICTGIPEIRLKRLKGTTIFKIEIKQAPVWLGGEPHFIDTGARVFKENGQLGSPYTLTVNQLINWLREHKV